MFIWFTLIFLSVVAGGICGWLVGGRRAVILGGAVPWFGLLALLLYSEYFAPKGPYQGGGASMWPIAQLFAGSVMAAVGGLVAAVTQGVKAKLWGEQDNKIARPLPNNGMHPTANQLGCHRELAAGIVDCAAGDAGGGISTCKYTY